MKKIARFIKSISLGQTIEKNLVRFHLYHGLLKVVDLTNAGKRGKIVKYFSVSYHDTDSPEIKGIVDEISKAQNYDKALEYTKKMLATKKYTIYLNEYEQKGIDTEPPGFKPISIKGDHVSINIDHSSFRIKNLDDKINEPTAISTSSNKKAVPMLFRWVEDNKSKIQNIDFSYLLKELDNAGIKYHEFLAID
jgi:hypothetical protein